MASPHRIARMQDGQKVPGTFLQAFIKNGDHFFVTNIKIYKDGMIDDWGLGMQLVNLEEFKEMVKRGWVRTRLPEGARVSMMVSSLNFTVSNVNAQVEEDEFIKEVEDEIRLLNGLPDSSQICIEAFVRYQQQSSKANKESLRRAYESVPKHKRKFLGDMDSKDWDYKRILGINS